ncbi:MAG: hypothetical protein QNJ72_15495 [Pleurocapsa sp. MO_226.B13]|nr:hypothetical protein [Pleurocapsa sp. MO_226.B13]
MLKKLWIYPPLAFARLGASDTPLASFHWSENDESPRGTGKTTIKPALTLNVDSQGNITSYLPEEIVFKDRATPKSSPSLFRPVCPFFEIHGEWEIDGTNKTGAITTSVLGQLGLTARDITWTVKIGNYKPYHYTLEEGDKIEGEVVVTGDDTSPKPLVGCSLPGTSQPLIPQGKSILLGSIQLTKPNDEFPEFRLRLTPAKGYVYGPTNLLDRSQQYQLPQEHLILNPDAAWCNWNPTSAKGTDSRTNPPSLYAQDSNSTSLGLVDDVGDGLISCQISDVVAYARFTVGPPDFQPDRRHVVSIADGLADRVKRLEVLEPSYMDSHEAWSSTELEIRDLMEKVYETMGGMNLDIQNERSQVANTRSGLPEETAEKLLFSKMEPRPGHDLPLTELGRQNHRRFIAYEVFKDRLREMPELFDKWIRNPYGDYPYYTRQMPALMRGSDAYPLSLTRRQYDLLKAWLKLLRQEVEDGE